MKKNKIVIFNKYIFLLLVVFAFLVTGATYSYLAYQYQNNSVIKGNVIAVDAELNVELVKGSNTKLIPLKDDGLTQAINGTGGEDVCVDANGNLSCQIYKITLTNKGSRIKDLKGTVTLYSANASSVYTDLKWRELSDLTTVKDGSVVNGMSKSTLVSGLTMESKEVRTWYIAVYVQNVDADQKNSNKGTFAGEVTFETMTSSSGDLVDVIKENAVSDSKINFASLSSETNGNGLYVRSGTESDTNPIYYYRGAVTNNNLLFAGFCWKIVRTTETGGTKLIYNGTPSNGTCINTGSSSQIGTKAFNSSYNSPAYVGYMYGKVYAWKEKTLSNDSTSYVYGNNVTYSNGTYTLSNTISSGSWGSIYNTSNGIFNHHYTCFTTGSTCSSVYYIFYTDSGFARYITLTGGTKVEDALSEMLDYNTTSSTIKGNKDTAGTIDNWYYTNIEQKGYSKYLEDTVWCNDRSIYQKNGWNPDGGVTSHSDWKNKNIVFSGYNRTYLQKSPNLTCSRDIDKFTVSSSNGNGNLDYPVGLLTNDEIMLAGAGGNWTANRTYYLYSGAKYWSGAPYDFASGASDVFYVYSAGNLDDYSVNYSLGVRPSISLKPGTVISSGDGMSDTPYVVQES